jgi:murein DD-endopeptidase MepM/ murein hydrolase activator NlpD
MRSLNAQLAFMLAASCVLATCGQKTEPAQTQVSLPLPTATSSMIPVASSTSPEFIPIPSSTQIPCDPLVASYCIVEGTFHLQRPIALPETNTIDRGYPYGSTENGLRDPHHGVEFYNGTGTPVLAAGDGKVFYSGDDQLSKFGPRLDFYGNLIILEHTKSGESFYTLYAHLSKIGVATGQNVSAGEMIAEVGATGAAIGSHLHFEVRSDPLDYESTNNPELWLTPLPGTGVLSLRFINKENYFVNALPNIQFYPDPSSTFIQAWQPETYDSSLTRNHWENCVLGDLPAGQFRITYLWAGTLYERWVEIQPGSLTKVELITK